MHPFQLGKPSDVLDASRMHDTTTSQTLLLSQIRDRVEGCFGYCPCLWQIRVVQALLKNDKDVVSISATGSAKSLTFWMPLLFIPEAVQIVITPLNILGKQNVETLTMSRVARDAEESSIYALLVGSDNVKQLPNRDVANDTSQRGSTNGALADGG